MGAFGSVSHSMSLKYQKSLMAPADYTKQLTGLLIELSKAQEAIDK